MIVKYKKIARTDMKSIRDYIKNELKSEKAANNLISAMLQAGSLLAENPHMGTLLNSKYDVTTEIRFLVIHKYIMFYEIGDGDVLQIIRVIDGRRDYMTLLF